MYLANPAQSMPQSTTEQLSYYALAERLDDVFPEGAPTLQSIYHNLTIRYGLTRKESDYLVNQAMKTGYIIKV